MRFVSQTTLPAALAGFCVGAAFSRISSSLRSLRREAERGRTQGAGRLSHPRVWILLVASEDPCNIWMSDLRQARQRWHAHPGVASAQNNEPLRRQQVAKGSIPAGAPMSPRIWQQATRRCGSLPEFRVAMDPCRAACRLNFRRLSERPDGHLGLGALSLLQEDLAPPDRRPSAPLSCKAAGALPLLVGQGEGELCCHLSASRCRYLRCGGAPGSGPKE